MKTKIIEIKKCKTNIKNIEIENNSYDCIELALTFSVFPTNKQNKAQDLETDQIKPVEVKEIVYLDIHDFLDRKIPNIINHGVVSHFTQVNDKLFLSFEDYTKKVLYYINSIRDLSLPPLTESIYYESDFQLMKSIQSDLPYPLSLDFIIEENFIKLLTNKKELTIKKFFDLDFDIDKLVKLALKHSNNYYFELLEILEDDKIIDYVIYLKRR